MGSYATPLRGSEFEDAPNDMHLDLDDTHQVLPSSPALELADEQSHIVPDTDIEQSPSNIVFHNPTPNQPIANSTDDSENTITDANPFTTTSSSRPSLPLKESLGLRGILGIIGGSVGAIGVLAFLTCLWIGHGLESDGTQALQLWRRIAMNDWMTRSITLGSVALRLIVSIQTTICTSMIAALLLEKYSVRRSLAAWFSVMRSMNDGPPRMVELMLSSKSFAVFRYIEFWLASLMITITLGLQFSSTILLLDMKDSEVLSDIGITSVPSLPAYPEGGNFNYSIIAGTFLDVPPSFPPFGEAQSGFSVDPDSNGLSNTGLIQRAFLPISERSMWED
ncbi:hypothetical protein F5Y13DRAFT_192852 [Hypoxylon sp. FL1857]|nr:hypothetical protein F5Y13DRAFT_192852 [Hypoxylon sp. FL1857]